MLAKIAVSAATYAIDKPYSYVIPQDMHITPGMRVIVPFGQGNRLTEGVVLATEKGSIENLKFIHACLDQEPVLSDTMLRLAAFLRERYFCTFYDAIRAMLPGGLWFRSRESFSLTGEAWQDKTIRKPMAKELLQYLQDLGGTATQQQLESLGDPQLVQEALEYLVKKKYVSGQKDLLRRVQDSTENIATLASTAEEAMAFAATRGRGATSQKAVLELLCSVGSAPVKEISYFTGASAATVRRLAELGYVELTQQPRLRCRQIQPAQVDTDPVLNDKQAEAYQGLYTQMMGEKPGVALLHGVTGSGKTIVYLKLIRACLQQGKSAMLLVPEIALTPQLLGILAAWFGDQVAVLHSSLPMSQRYDQWKRIHQGDARVVVGTRSAVFAPWENPGVLILDEEQEHTYRSEQAPRYDAREVAIWRGARENALVVLGSATPSVESMFRAKSGIYTLYSLPGRYNGRALPRVEIVDMKHEIQEGNDTAFSLPLRQEIINAQKTGKQTILFLNRRGNSRALVCVDCRQAPECPRCSARLTYHSANNRLMCHYCGYSRPVPDRCGCGGRFKTVGVGTQKAQQELQQLLPDIGCVRLDADTVSAANTHEMILDRFKSENIPVLLGTQMVAKGLDIPNVTLVGVLDGDLGLYSGGYRAAENTFNMLTQVVGRAGRGESSGMAVLQTMTPEHLVIGLAARQDYMGFYDMEIRLRQHMGLPPFGDQTILTFSGEEEARVMRACAAFRDSLQHCLALPEYKDEICTVLGPAPCPVPKINFHYRYRLTLRGKLSKPLRRLLEHLLRQFLQDRANRGISAYVDVNGFE
jgi:primosomal protein N' (replication factor Y)